MSIETILTPILANICQIDKWQRDFIVEYFKILFSRQGRANFENLSRYSKYDEITFRRQFSKYFDWVAFNIGFINFETSIHIGVLDCSFVPKSGKKTFGLDKFWSGAANMAKKGLEISVLGCINVDWATAYVIDVTQTPANLSTSQTAKYSRTDFYMEQVLDCLFCLATITYFVADGFYAKIKVMDTLIDNGKHLITKLRCDANLRYLNNKPRAKGQLGPNIKYDGKVVFDWGHLSDKDKWDFVGEDSKYNHLTLYCQKLYAIQFERALKVVLLLNHKTNTYVLLASTDVDLDARLIVKYYQLRFQIEFLFRDAKQFMGLNDCQARDEAKLDFHFNASLSAVILARTILQKDEIYNKSMNNFMRYQYNQKFIDTIYSKLSILPEFDLNNSIWKDAPKWGNIAA
jgi:Transposase DDE domain